MNGPVFWSQAPLNSPGKNIAGCRFLFAGPAYKTKYFLTINPGFRVVITQLLQNLIFELCRKEVTS